MRTVIVFFAAIIGVATVATLATRHLIEQPQQTQDALHRWLHERLQLTPDQENSLRKIDGRFSTEEERLRDALVQANRDLAAIIREENSYTPRVAAAVERIHHEMGELQKLSIEHLYEMKTVLTPEQGARLMDFAEMALTENP